MKETPRQPVTYIDLFCGIGGFRVAAEMVALRSGVPLECVFSSDIDKDAQAVYEKNFGERPFGDITKVQEREIPDHDILFGGFPCQAFSIIGKMKGFEDARGTLFFDIARILKEKKPRAFILENVKQLRGHDGGRTLTTISEVLTSLGYWHEYRVLNALDFGLPQKRERVVIVGFRDEEGVHKNFRWPDPNDKRKTLEDVLDDDEIVPGTFFISERIKSQREKQMHGKTIPAGRTIWHENKSGNVSPLPYSCALRAGASYNYLLVDGKRRLTGREMLRLQGFPDTFQMASSYTVTRRQAGNSVPVPLISAVMGQVINALKNS